MKNFVVAGANGYIGSAVVECLRENGYRILAVTPSCTRRYEPISPCSTGQKQSAFVCNVDLEDAGTDWDVFVNLAWRGTYGERRRNSKIQTENIFKLYDHLNLAKSLGCSRFVGIGSIIEHEFLLDNRLDNKYTYRPDYLYALAKMFTHAALFVDAADYGLDPIWCSLTNVYGVGDHSHRLINYTLEGILSGKTLYFSKGTQTYDFIYIEDAAKAIIEASINGHPNEDYLIGSGSPASLKSFLETIRAELAPDAKFVYSDAVVAGPDIPVSHLSTDKLFEHTGFRPEVPFREGVKKLYSWMKER